MFWLWLHRHLGLGTARHTMTGGSPVSCIYCLFSTADGRPRYVGQTTKTPPIRYYRHLGDAWRRRGTPLHRWIRITEAQGFEIRAFVLQTNVAPGDLDLFERYWMAQFASLLNTGAGTPNTAADTAVAIAVQRALARALAEPARALKGTIWARRPATLPKRPRSRDRGRTG
jgi:hypothetical protein